MPLPYKVESLDDVPEAARELYEERDGAFVLPVEGVKTEEDVGALERALERVKEERNKLRSKAERFSEDDAEELARLRDLEAKREEEKAKAEGRWEDLRTKLQKKHEESLNELQATLKARESVIENLTVTNELRSRLAKSVDPGYLDAAEALLLRNGPKVVWQDGKPVGVFPNEVEGDVPIGAFVDDWLASDDAKRFLPPANGAGGGADGRRASGDRPSWEGKKFTEMTTAEQVEYTEHKYGGGAEAA